VWIGPLGLTSVCVDVLGLTSVWVDVFGLTIVESDHHIPDAAIRIRIESDTAVPARRLPPDL